MQAYISRQTSNAGSTRSSNNAGPGPSHSLPGRSTSMDEPSSSTFINAHGATAEPLDDGRIDIKWDPSAADEKLAAAPPPAYSDLFGEQDDTLIKGHGLPQGSKLTLGIECPPLQIVMQIVGSRGDVQPFIPIAQRLVKLGHRVRVATHERFRSFVREYGLEFYPLGGNPEELMAFMVKNRTVLPGLSSMLAGDVARNREMMGEILTSTYKSCVDPDDETGREFFADVVIANPPSYGHIHCAEALSIPCHIIFTMPWTPTNAFPHPLTNISHSKETQGAQGVVNFSSYGAVEMLTWSGLSDLVNDFRVTLGLGKVTAFKVAGLMNEFQVPHTYLWSPALIPKPKDWGSHVDIVGFSFVDPPKTQFTPPEDLARWLAAGPPPFYIGFGSIAGFDMAPLIAKIMEAVDRVSVRVIVSKGWGGANVQNSEGVFMIGDCPHDWLFTKVAGVVHHGGAGTCSAGLRLGRPTIVVPFFADQPFWGAMVATAGAGPPPIPARELTVETMVHALEFCLLESTRAAAGNLARQIAEENGADGAVRSFFSHLPVGVLINKIDSREVAAVVHAPSKTRLSMTAARVLVSTGQIKLKHVADYRAVVWDMKDTIGDVWVGSEAIKGVYQGFEGVVNRPKEGYANGNIAKGVALGVGSLVWYPAKGALKTFGQFGNALRNLPASYDPTATTQKHEITGIGSGLAAAARATRSNVYHAATDVFTKPVTLGRERGAIGVAQGVAIGLTNTVVKSIAIVADMGALPAKGVYRHIYPKKDLRRPGHLARLVAALEPTLSSVPRSPEKISMDYHLQIQRVHYVMDSWYVMLQNLDSPPPSHSGTPGPSSSSSSVSGVPRPSSEFDWSRPEKGKGSDSMHSR